MRTRPVNGSRFTDIISGTALPSPRAIARRELIGRRGGAEGKVGDIVADKLLPRRIDEQLVNDPHFVRRSTFRTTDLPSRYISTVL